ncbi:uncharacterized protein A4U43_C06F1220 [Asparagus officinalis]|uniref:Transglycosylase SLT domain-containing protein n=2 Tax=Asparagus officinalis TaxID=4686 RepID=A0A5P1EIQ6_ASPOF|nr:uncharacterized protein A4U43_C06F1220 [Asparagus officinalis]
MMSVSFKYWDDCVDPEDMQLLWTDRAVRKEWTDANERKGHKIHLSRDPDGQPYLTQTEMRAVAGIVVERHFKSQIDSDMICALAEILSDRQLLAEQYDKKTKETKMGIMQISPMTADWLIREMGYKNYVIQENANMLYKPFINVYFGAAYIKWLSCYDEKERSEEYVVRAYKCGIIKAAHKSTTDYFQRYLFIKDSLPPKSVLKRNHKDLNPAVLAVDVPSPMKAGDGYAYWDARVSQEDMEDMWRNPDVVKEWSKSGEIRGRVRFSQDEEKSPYLSRVEVKALAQIIIQRYFSTREIQAAALAALAEVCSMRFVNGVRTRTGLMGIDYPTASWLYREIGHKEYKVSSVDDVYNPFVSMYFGASYFDWLSEYKGR